MRGNNVIGGRERAKQIDVRKHLAHEANKNGHLILKKVPTTLQLADIMTKDVKQPQWGMCMDGLLGKPLVPSVQTVVAQEEGGMTNCTFYLQWRVSAFKLNHVMPEEGC